MIFHKIQEEDQSYLQSKMEVKNLELHQILLETKVQVTTKDKGLKILVVIIVKMEREMDLMIHPRDQQIKRKVAGDKDLIRHLRNQQIKRKVEREKNLMIHHRGQQIKRMVAMLMDKTIRGVIKQTQHEQMKLIRQVNRSQKKQLQLLIIQVTITNLKTNLVFLIAKVVEVDKLRIQ